MKKMKKTLLLCFLTFVVLAVKAQPVGYYNGTAGLRGDELKTKLNEIIGNHVDFSYSQAKFIINYSDADPNNENNVILFYTQRSQNADTYGTGEDFINREHVWAKSHGTFENIRPMDGDAFNLRPADGSVNVERSNKDFGNVQPNGTRHPEATECWYSADKWEPGPASKGQVARIIFYMATRYEGKNGELDLEVVNGLNTYPKPEHGDLATLLEWNREYPPSDFERRRNERIFTIQQNRNPFVDNPEWADLIWAEEKVNPIQFDNFSLSVKFPKAGDIPNISFSILTELSLDEVTLTWGDKYDSGDELISLKPEVLNQNVAMDLGSFRGGEMVYFKIVAKSGSSENSYRGSFQLPENITAKQLTPISDFQKPGDASPMLNKTVTFAGRVVGNYDNALYLQSGNDPYSGVCVYGSLKTGYVGDSLVIRGKVTEYNKLTEITDVDYVYNFKSNKVVEPIVLKTNEINEAYEGMLVTVKNAIFTNAGETVPDENTSYAFSDDTGSSSIYFRYGSRMLGKKIPYGICDVTGVVSQFQDTYQLLPRSINDFTAEPDTIAPIVVSVTAIDKAWITVQFNERVEKISSENLANYTFNNGITLLSAYRYEEGNTVILNIAELTNGTHTLTINNISDESGNTNGSVVIDFTSNFTGVDDLKLHGFEVYPNPATEGKVCINSKQEIENIQLFNLDGRLIKAQTVKANFFSTNINVIPGIYLLSITFENSKTVISKIVFK